MLSPDTDKKFARDTLVTIVRAVALNRAINEIGVKRTAVFWGVISGGMYDTAVIDWCILFGSDHQQNQKLHWKNMFEADAFREALLKAVGMSREEWRKYHAAIKAYRDENAAHRSLDPSSDTFPNFSPALEAAYVYWDWIKGGLEQGELSLRDEYERMSASFLEVAKIAINATTMSGHEFG